MPDFEWSPEAIDAVVERLHGLLGDEPQNEEAYDDLTWQILDTATEAQPVVALPLCPTCKGMGGRIITSDGDLDRGAPVVRDKCPACNGSGVERLVPVSEIVALLGRIGLTGSPSVAHITEAVEREFGNGR